MKKALVFILLGQSNAVGHGAPMAEEDKIEAPLTNVFGLSREDNYGFSPNGIKWSGYTSHGMNLAEILDHTYSVASCMAAEWQKRIDEGEALPDLYIVHIAIGAQGVTKGYMWHVDRESVYSPGTLSEADVSLYRYTCNILSRLADSFAERGITPEYLLHWRGGENDITVPRGELESVLFDLYTRMLAGFYGAIGHTVPTVLHLIPIKERTFDMDPTGAYFDSMNFINETFEKIAAEKSFVSLFDSRKAPFYEEHTRTHGIFVDDAVHYTAETNAWVAGEIIKSYINL